MPTMRTTVQFVYKVFTYFFGCLVIELFLVILLRVSFKEEISHGCVI